MEDNYNYEQNQFLINTYHNGLINFLNQVSNKLAIRKLDLSNLSIVQLKIVFVQQFFNVIDLNLSNCLLNEFENGVFDTLFHLKSINLSNNLIGNTDNRLFKLNTNLTAINLRHNYLEWINRTTFLMLTNLETLDLSYNFIKKLSNDCLIGVNLKELYINNNLIVSISSNAFDSIPNLTRLALNDNKITNLDYDTFYVAIKVQYLNLNNNRLESLHSMLFLELNDLTILYLSNNVISNNIKYGIFASTQNLIELDLSNNNIDSVGENVFDNCSKLKVLSLTVFKKFPCRSIALLTSLQKFQLVYVFAKYYYLHKSFWCNFKNKSELVVLKLIIRKIVTITIASFSHLINLEYLHIECTEPNVTKMIYIDFGIQFKNMPKLNKTILKRLNYFQVFNYPDDEDFETNNMKYIDFTGIKMSSVVQFYQKFENLEYLNLSFSTIAYIHDDAFKYSAKLKEFNIEHSKLSSISSLIFKYTIEMEFLNISNCCIRSIEDFSFQNLKKLRSLDIRHNFVTNYTTSMFFGLNHNAQVII